MNCEQAINLLSARIDGETVDDVGALDAHLANCADCRGLEEALRMQDAALEDAFAPHRAAAKRLAERFTVASAADRTTRSPATLRSRIGWLTTVAGMAAGFMLAVALFRPWERRVIEVRVPVPVTGLSTAPVSREVLRCATLSVATGKVEIQSADDGKWEALPTGGFVCATDLVRTGPDARCEFVTTDGSAVRLDNSTQLRFKSSREVDLTGGQLWSTVAGTKDPFLVQMPAATVSALGSQFDVQHAQDQTTLTVVRGSTRVRGAAGDRTVGSGQRLRIVNGTAGNVSNVDDLTLATRWVNELLILKGRDNDELHRRVDDLFARIGETKMSSLYEEEIRALGDHCVVPLSRYIRSDRSNSKDAKRRDAARIVADVAQPWSAGELIELLGDRDPIIRALAAGALQRVTGESMGRSPEEWNQHRPGPDDEPLKRWREWWDTNKTRFPGTPLPGP